MMNNNKAIKDLTRLENISYKECNISTLFTKPFYMITIDDKPLGDPITKEQADFLMQWFQTVLFEYNEQHDQWDRI